MVSAAAAVTLAITAAGCHPSGPASGGNGNKGGDETKRKTLVVGSYVGTTVQRNFNPFSPRGNSAGGLVYEPLFDFNMANGGKFEPLLGTKYAYGNDGKRVTVKLDPHANWSDGSKLTSSDVVFSMNYQKKNGVLGYDFKKVQKTGKHAVTIDFKKPAHVLIQDVGETLIIPKRIWKDHNAKKWTNPHPVGSGPYKLSKFNSQRVTFAARDNYWGKHVTVPKVAYTVQGDQATQQLLKHKMDAAAYGLPNIKRNFADRDSSNHFWPIPVGAHVIDMNNKRKPFDDVHVRRAVSLALDGKDIGIAYNPGADKAVSPTGLAYKQFSDWVPKRHRAPLRQNLKKAKKELAKSAYKTHNGKLVDAHGKQISVTLKEGSDYTDALAYDKATTADISKLGIKAETKGESNNAADDDNKHYNYDMVMKTYNYGLPSPYRFYNEMLRAHRETNTTKDHGNYSRWNDSATESALDGLEHASTKKQQKSYVHKLQKIFLDKVPAAVTTTRTWPCEYTTAHWKGWPTKSNPYAMCAPQQEDFASTVKMMQTLHPANQGG